MPDLHHGADQIPDHPVKETVSVKGQFQKTALLFHDPDRADMACGGLTFVPWIGGEGGKVVFARENFGGLTHYEKIEWTGNVPSPSNFERVKRIGVGDPVEIGFSLGREAGVKAGFFAANR